MGGAGARGGEERRGAGPGLGGLEARNLEESQAVEAKAARDTRTVEERVWQHLASLNDPQPSHSAALPHTLSSWSLPASKSLIV